MNKKDGSLIWSRELEKGNGVQNYSPVLIGSRLWVASSNGQLNSFELTTGKVIDELKASTGFSGSVLAYSGTMLLPTVSGELIAFK